VINFLKTGNIEMNKILTTMRNVWILSIVFIINIIIQSTCYAGFVTTVTEITIKCSPSEKESQPQYHPGAPRTYLSLITKGVRVDNKEHLISLANWDWQNNRVLVVARCISPDGNSVTKVEDMFPYLRRYLDTPSTTNCERGEGMSIQMYKPNDTDPDKYQYVADLKIDRFVQHTQTAK
jgi:hypothetical protein